MEIITKQHPDFSALMYAVDKEIKASGCHHTYECFKNAAIRVEKKYSIQIDVLGTIEYFKQHGGYCDCEILFNVAN